MRYLSILIFLQISNITFGQYIPLHLETGTCWHTTRHIDCNNSTFSTLVSEHTSVTKDTMINSLKYYKIHKHTVQIATANPNPPTSDIYFYLRNDTLNKKVFSFENGSDSLLYDFNLTIGDIIPRTSLLVDTIGASTIFGVSRKFYGVKTPSVDTKPSILFIEGIGENRSVFQLLIPSYDPLFAGAGAWIYSNVLSCGYNGMPLYGDSIAASNCFPLAITNITKDYSSFKLFPTITHSILNIESDLDNYQIEIYNVEGKCILKKYYSHSENINISNLSNGLYFVKIQAQKEYKVVKIIKE